MQSEPNLRFVRTELIGLDLVVDSQIPRQLISSVSVTRVRSQVRVFIFYSSPKSFNQHAVSPASRAFHADLDSVVLQDLDELETRDLTALVGTHDFRDPIFGNGLS